MGTRLAQRLADARLGSRVRVLGLPDDFLPQGSRSELLATHGLDVEGLVSAVRGELADRHPSSSQRWELVAG